MDAVGMATMFILRPAVDNNYDFIWQLAVTTMQEYVAALWGWDKDWQKNRFRTNFDATKWQIIEVERQDVGAVAVTRGTTEGENIFLDYLYLLPQYQRRGIGSAIVRDLIEEASAANKVLALNVLKSNPDAKRLYEKLGLIVTEEIETRWLMSTVPSLV